MTSVRGGGSTSSVQSVTATSAQVLVLPSTLTPRTEWDLLYTRREAEGKASIPPRAVQTFSQHPLVDSLRQLATTTENPAIRNTLSAVGVRTFDDGMFTYRVNFTAFYEALLSAKVIELCGGVLSVRGGGGAQVVLHAKVQDN